MAALQSYDPPDWPNAERRRGTGMHPNDGGFDDWHLHHALETEDKGSRYADPAISHNGDLQTYRTSMAPTSGCAPSSTS